MRMRSLFCLVWPCLLAWSCGADEPSPFRVEINTSDAPEHAKWAESAAKLGTEWFPRIVNLLASPQHPSEAKVFHVKVSKDYKGVAFAAGGSITISSGWVAQHPEDSNGVIIHELTHVVQSYPGGGESWIIEGIADYVRFGIYEAKPQSWFPKPQKEKGYRDSYKIAAGFFLWLEAGPAPGIVRKLNAALHDRKYDVGIFEKAGGKPLDALWTDYVGATAAKPAAPAPLPKDPGIFRYTANGGGTFEHKEGKLWIEYRNGAELWRFNESERNAEYVELLDEQRGMRLRLTGDRVLMQRNNGWLQLYSGTWKGPEGPPEPTPPKPGA